MTEYVEDRTETFIGGQDAWLNAEDIGENQYQRGINVTHRRGVLGPRSGYERLSLQFDKGGFTNAKGFFIPWRKLFAQGKFQACIPYRKGDDVYLLIVISGFIYRVNVQTKRVTILNEDGPRPNQYLSRVNWSFAGKYIVLFDFPNYPLIIDGTEVRRSDPERKINGLETPEVPPAQLGAFNQNRLFIANEGGEFTAGDPVGSPITDPPITFAEVLGASATFPNQSFQLGTEGQDLSITAMTYLQMTDSSSGIGPLLVATQNAIHAYRSDLERTLWQKERFGQQILGNAGIAGPRALVNVNKDLFFLSAKGEVRSLSMSRDEQGRWSAVPLSNEVSNWLKFWDESLARFAVLAYHNNKIFISANPIRVECLDLNQHLTIDYAHAGMVVLDAENFSRLGRASEPAWDGLWLGVRPMDMCTTPDGDCYVVSKDLNSVNRIYKMRDDLTYDLIDGKEQYVTGRLYTRDYAYKNKKTFKENYTGDLGIEEIRGDFDINVERKPNHSPNFLPWRKFSYQVPWRNCTANPLGINGLAAHTMREFSLGSPDDGNACDPVTREQFKVFRRQQLRVTIRALSWILNDIQVIAEVIPNVARVTACEEFPIVEVKQECDTDWALGQTDNCIQPVT